MSHVLDSDEEEEDQHDLAIEVEPHEILDPNPISIPNKRPNPRWPKNLIEGELGPSIRMSMWLFPSQISSLHSGAIKF